ncbi:4-phosphoerythronate dehydrogenase [Catonella morbi ATCC 51271]|uniref:D-3-phosphoglycerate dehydrogenase n=1 Tax=Catonella morbi ATCC 51271 TaxID=592026 RepID=V2Y1B8_9FIRM|nr:phosphoglycerate dehydrogenase [Catonella morbi]ESL02763.1 4-phosphoerythronate dehydrogenase [Catonella morbi ATCC 51271]
MYKVKTLNKISDIGLKEFTDNYSFTEELNEADAVLVRSADMKSLEFGGNLLAVARAGAGVNNIPLDKCAEQGIVVFNTPGANANAVKELVIAGLLLAARDVVGGINWVQANKGAEGLSKLVEKEKSNFAGNEIEGKKLGVIGLGAIGVLVANAAKRLGMEVYGCDPYISVEHAWSLSRDVIHVKTVEEIFRTCDYITVHVPLMDATKHMINADNLKLMKDGVVILNFSRDALVNDEDIEKALADGKVKKYVTDFPNEKSANMDGVIAIPHLGASTEESEDNCAVMAVKEIMNYLENGSIKNSVNYPNCEVAKLISKARITLLHKNIPSMITKFTTVLSSYNVNIEEMVNKSRGDYAYSVFDIDTEVTEEMKKALEEIEGVLKVRAIQD